MAVHGLHLGHLAQQKAQHVDVVDQVDQDRAAAGLAAPGHVEIRVGLEEGGQRGGADDAAELPIGNQRAGALVDRVVAAVVAHQHGRAGVCHGIGQLAGFGHRVGHGLFDQGRDAA